MSLAVGQLFVLGFRGKEIPAWLADFEKRFGLGGVILFDYDCQKKAYDNNVHSPAQVRELCARIHAMPSHPLVLIDQEGGKVRRLKEKLGFAPLPSAKALNLLSTVEQTAVVERSFVEMRDLGIDYDLAPVIDLDTNPANPDIGAIERSFSAKASDVRRCFGALNEAARDAGLGLCLKHYPGLGGATVNSHEELTDLSGTVSDEQLELFYSLGRTIHGGAILVSHGILREWEKDIPVSMSVVAIQKIRAQLPEALLLSDDLQMQGLQKKLSSKEASIQGVRAGLDWILIGNNLIAEDERCLSYAQAMADQAESDPHLRQKIEESLARVKKAKDRFINR